MTASINEGVIPARRLRAEEPRQRGKPQAKKTDETVQRLLHRIEDYRIDDLL